MPPEEQQLETYHPFLFIQFIKKFKITIVGAIAVLLIAIIFYIFSWSAPNNFPVSSIYDLKSGQTLSVVSDNFSKLHIVKSEFWFKSIFSNETPSLLAIKLKCIFSE